MATIVTASESAAVSQLQQVVDLATSPSYKWFSLQDNKLDGTFHPISPSYQIGWWGVTLSDANGNLTPAPTLTIQLDGIQSVPSIRVAGDVLLDEYPVDFTCDIYDDSDVLIRTVTITGNTDAVFKQPVTPTVTGAAKLIFTITKLNKANRTVKITEALNIFEIFSADDLSPKLSETNFETVSFSSTDVLKPKLTDTSIQTITLYSQDTPSVVVNDVISITAALSSNDTLEPKITEANYITATVLSNDDLSPKLVDNVDIAVALDSVDDISPKISDTVVVTTHFSSQDTIEVLTTGASTVNAIISGTDDLATIITDSVVIAVSMDSMDNLQVAISESDLQNVSFISSDELTPKTLETSGAAISIASEDSVTVAVDGESFFTQYEIWKSDNIKIDTDHAKAMAANLSSVDNLTPEITEIDVANVFLDSNDMISSTIVDIVAITASMSSTDVVAISSIDNAAAEISFDSQDTLEIESSSNGAIQASLDSTDDIGVRFDKAVALNVNLVSADVLPAASMPSVNVTASLNSIDELTPNISEAATLQNLVISEDTIPVESIGTSFFTLYEIWRNDTLKPKIVDNAIADVSLSSSDVLKPKLLNTVAVTATFISVDAIIVNGNVEADIITAELFSMDDLKLLMPETSGVKNVYTETDADVRRIYAKVIVTYTDPFNDETISYSVSELGDNTSTSQLSDNIVGTQFKWFALHDNLLDGTYHPLPTLNDPNYKVGWWGTTLADANGILTPTPVVAVIFSPRALISVLVAGDDKAMNFPVDFIYRAYNALDEIVYEEIVTDNTEPIWGHTITPVLAVTKIEVTVQKISKPGSVARLTELFTAIKETYLSDDVESIRVLEEIGYQTGGLPIGNMSANEVDIVLSNIDRRFDLNNQSSSLYGFVKRNRRVDVFLGIEVLDDEIEWHPQGVFWTTSWDIPKNGLSASLTARDRLELLRLTDFAISPVYIDMTALELFEIILQDAGVTSSEYVLDPSLSGVLIPYAWFNKMSHRDALQRLSGCAIIQVYTNKLGQIVVNLDLDATSTVMATFDEDINTETVTYPLAVAEQVNYIEVTATQWIQSSGEQILDTEGDIMIAAGGSVTKEYVFTTVPAIAIDDPVIAADTGIVVDSYTAYAWGVQITLRNDGVATGSVTKVTVTGTILKNTGSTTLLAKNDESIREDGKVKATVSHDFIQNTAYAQSLADSILATYTASRYDATIKNRGNIALRLGDRVAIHDEREGLLTEYVITRQTIDWQGYLDATTEAKKL